MKAKKILRIGMVGFGSMGKTHSYAISNLPFYFGDLPFCASVAGLCTTSFEAASAICKLLLYLWIFT